MQMTIEIPDDLADQIEPERNRLAEIIRRGLSQRLSTESAVGQEIIEFLARGPEPREIVAFRPSEASVQRVSKLLDKNRAETMTADEQAEMDEVCAWNDVFALIKVHARRHVRATPAA